MAEKPDIVWHHLIGFMRSVRMMSVERAEHEGLIAVYALLVDEKTLVPRELRGEFLGRRCGKACPDADGVVRGAYNECGLWAYHGGPCRPPSKESP